VASFGSRAFVEVQRHRVTLEVPTGAKPASDDDPPSTKRLSRRSINDIVGRVRQLFHWGVLVAG
jgi:hypothetical protein